MDRHIDKKRVTGVLACLLAGSLCASDISEAQAETAAVAPDEEAPVSLINKKSPEEAKAWYVPNFTWGDVNINYLDWSSGSLSRKPDAYKDFPYIELEGGAGWDWGDLYFFTDVENPTSGFKKNALDDTRWVIKPVLDINIPKAEGLMKNVQIHIQDYYLYGKNFLVNNFVIGLAYKYVSEDFFIRPFIGGHYAHDTFNESQWNGYMGGWVFNYNFDAFDQKFSLSNWHEFEWDRADDFQSPFGDGASWGVQGALAGWWHVTKHVTGGIQYRYAYHKLGSYGYLDGVIYTLKYNF
jgi:nucleoside-specific outer membrane channel protein Tsx